MIFNPLKPSDECMRRYVKPSWVWIMAWRQLADKALLETMLVHWKLDHCEQSYWIQIILQQCSCKKWFVICKVSTIFSRAPCVKAAFSLQWRQNEHDGVSNHQPHGCLLNRFYRRRSKKTSKLRVTSLCEGTNGQQRGKCFHLMTSSWSTCLKGRLRRC